MAENQTTRRHLPVTEAETTNLMAASGPDRPLLLGFGSGGVALDTHRSSWALPLLKEMRANG